MERSRNAIVLMMGVPSRRFFDLSCFPAPVESLLPLLCPYGKLLSLNNAKNLPANTQRIVGGPVLRRIFLDCAVVEFRQRLGRVELHNAPARARKLPVD